MAVETTYGVEKRLRYVSEEIERCHAKNVLDVGCGTGANLTRPLAERFPELSFLGVDSNAPSIQAAQAQPGLANLEFRVAGPQDVEGEFDLVICSEVLEHLHEPLGFLKSLGRPLRNGAAKSSHPSVAGSSVWPRTRGVVPAHRDSETPIDSGLPSVTPLWSVEEAVAQASSPGMPGSQAVVSELRDGTSRQSPSVSVLNQPHQERLAEGGRLILTVPNGYGPYEASMLALTVCRTIGLTALVRFIKTKVLRVRVQDRPPGSLDPSPHVQHFTLRELRRLAREAGFVEERYQARTFLCGFVWDRALSGQRVLKWNGQVADRLPAWAVSGWMLTLVKAGRPRAESGCR
jgi:SAM-dependent methyltransferase